MNKQTKLEQLIEQQQELTTKINTLKYQIETQNSKEYIKIKNITLQNIHTLKETEKNAKQYFNNIFQLIKHLQTIPKNKLKPYTEWNYKLYKTTDLLQHKTNPTPATMTDINISNQETN